MAATYRRDDDTVETWRNLWFPRATAGCSTSAATPHLHRPHEDCIRRRGENISVWEVKSTINAHDAVLECAAYGVASELSEART